MNASNNTGTKVSGGCLCGEVRFEIIGSLRNIVNCHCAKCRRFHGNFGAYTSIAYEDLRLIKDSGLKWYDSITDETPNVQRGFCHLCGASMFWYPRGRETIAVAAGSLDEPTGLKTIGHIWMSQQSDYYDISDDLPCYEMGWE